MRGWDDLPIFVPSLFVFRRLDIKIALGVPSKLPFPNRFFNLLRIGWQQQKLRGQPKTFLSLNNLI
jgi:hypothetical protein